MTSKFDAALRLGRASALSRRSLLQALAVTPAGLALAPTPALASTTMSWMGWQGFETPILTGTFLEDHDIDFQPTFVASNEEIITRLQAGGIGRTDLVTMYFGYLQLMDEAGLVEPVDQSRIVAWDRLIPEFRDHPAIRNGDRLLGVPWNWGSLPLMYDPAVIPETPASWMDVFKDDYRGRVAMVDDPLGNLLVWGPVLTGRPDGTLLSRAELTEVIDTLIRLKTEHARAFFPTYGEMADAFARGEVVISAIGWEAVAVWAAAKGKEIRYTIPAEGTTIFMDTLTIPAEAPNIDLTYAMINHILSPEPQRVFATEQSAGITNLDAVPLLPAELAASYGYADLPAKLGRARLVPMPPTESDGTVATYDDFLAEYARLQAA
jgi:spermidine/putrescine transport system substrate-binding protein